MSFLYLPLLILKCSVAAVAFNHILLFIITVTIFRLCDHSIEPRMSPSPRWVLRELQWRLCPSETVTRQQAHYGEARSVTTRKNTPVKAAIIIFMKLQDFWEELKQRPISVNGPRVLRVHSQRKRWVRLSRRVYCMCACVCISLATFSLFFHLKIILSFSFFNCVNV